MKKEKTKLMSNASVPMIVPVVLLIMIIGLIYALVTQGPSKIFNIVNNADNYESSKGTIKFKEESYTCTEGDKFETMITAEAPKNSKVGATIKSYGTSDEEVAIIDDNTVNQVRCINCRVVRVICKKAGRILLNAESSTGATTSSELIVKQREGTISYSKANYSCKAGESFETMIKTTNGLQITSFKSSDTKIASVDTNTSLQTNCIDCKLVKVTCHKAGKVKLTATASNGATTTSNVTVEKSVGTISFAENSYTCNAGETFETLITAKNTDAGTYVKSYKSSDENIATIDDNTKYQVNCINCRLVRVVCKRKGNVTLSATSSSGAETSVTLSVKVDIGTIKFEKETYSCTAGETFETKITASSKTAGTYVKSYTTSDATIATIDNNTTLQTNCSNCTLVRVLCHKAGNVTLNAESSTGAKTVSNLTVNENVGTIKFDKTSYTCNAGERFETLITADGPVGAYVKSYSSSNEAIATVDGNAINQVRCINCKMVRVLCHNAGTVTLKATSSTGAKTSVSLKVNKKIGTISFDKTSYTCTAGQTFETMITAKNASPGTYIRSYGTSNSTIATIDDNTSVQVNCINCRIVRVVCKKKGSVILNAQSSSGAKTTSSLTVNAK